MFAFSEAAYELENKVDMNQTYWQRTIADRLTEQVNLFYTENAEDGYRMHLGWSVIGAPCLRYIYYHWNWFMREEHEARMERIFIEGHKIEFEIREIMKARGAQFLDKVDEDGKQIKVSDLGNHFGGSADGVFIWPIIGITEPMLLECKSTKTQGFKPLVNKGVQAEKPQHYSQQSGYGWKLGLKYCAYVTRDKNTSQIYVEIVDLDWTTAEENTRKAQFVILTNELPKRISEKASYFVCNMCSYKPICHGDAMPTLNCRNCTNCQPRDKGAFFCLHWNQEIPNKEALIKGCPNHNAKPY